MGQMSKPPFPLGGHLLKDTLNVLLQNTEDSEVGGSII